MAAKQTDVAKGRRSFAETRGFWVGEMKRLPAEDGDQSIKDQPQRRRRRSVGLEERDTLISVVPALTLMATSNGLMPAAGICFSGIRFFFFFLWCLKREKINTWEHSMTGASFQN